MNRKEVLETGLGGLGIGLEDARRGRLLDYVDLLQKWNRTYNLTAIHEPERMLTHHVLDSLAILPWVGTGRLLDVGSGAGLPGIPLAVARPDLEITLLDASQKRCAFMQQAIIQLGIANAAVVHARAEDFRPEVRFPRIVTRAFSDLAEFVRLTGHLLAEGGRWLAMKGVYPDEEIALLKGARVVQDARLHVPGLEADRHLICLERAG